MQGILNNYKIDFQTGNINQIIKDTKDCLNPSCNIDYEKKS